MSRATSTMRSDRCWAFLPEHRSHSCTGPAWPCDSSCCAESEGTMTHDTWIDRLSEYVDGELDASTARALETHLAGCPDCRAIADDLRSVSARARALPVVPPPSDLWQGIESRIHESRIVPLRPTARRTGLFVSWPRLAAAGLLLGVVSGGAVYGVTRFQARP